MEGLAAIAGRRRVHVHSDSAYVVNCFRDRWWERWERTGWIGASKQPVANRDLWERLLAETRRHDVHWHKVRGHSGDPLNERVDALARQAISTRSGGASAAPPDDPPPRSNGRWRGRSPRSEAVLPHGRSCSRTPGARQDRGPAVGD